MKSEYHGGYALGLDVGSNSVGWAVIDNKPEEESGTPNRVVRTGVRAFEPGVEGDLMKGTEESRAKARREARLARRQTSRRARRHLKAFHILQKAKLLPPFETEDQDRHILLTTLDNELLGILARTGEDRAGAAKKLPYLLRAAALDEKLEPHAVGRALYHLAQRRGFKSNRKAPEKKDEDHGKVKKEIGELREKINEAGARTLGEFFAKLDPEEARIRNRYTHRAMCEDEFEKIWTAQAAHHGQLMTEKLKEELHNAIFHQRKLKSQKHRIGKCELEPDRPRAPIALLAAQKFRLLQKVNDTSIDNPDGTTSHLTDEQRQILIDALNVKGDITFAAARKLLGIPKNHKFNWERGGEKRFIGNRTAAKLAEIFGEERWTNFSDEERDSVIEDCLSIHEDHALARRGERHWGLTPERAEQFGAVKLEDGHLHLGRKAIGKLLPLMEKGVHYATAVQEVYDPPAPEPRDILPPVDEAVPGLTNPAVRRSLTELRKVVNSVVKQYGKPEGIRIEFARNLRSSKKRRTETWKKNRANEKAREDAAEQIVKETGLQKPTRTDIQKYLLAVECNWLCPYSGKKITPLNLLGPSPQFDIEHIIPRSLCLDNSYTNKTLCHNNENRKKGGRTPFQAYGHDEQRWHEIISRVKTFKGNLAQAKLRRFMLQGKELDEFVEGFSSRLLNDTRYIAKLAKKYLGLLYGGEEKKRPVRTTTGQVTGLLRDHWGLNSILNDGGEKTRDDHRHHAVDAIAIALTNDGTIKKISDVAKRADLEYKRRMPKIDPPWDGFLLEAENSIMEINVSHRVSRKVKGEMHEATNYSPPRDERGNIDPEKGKFTHFRKPVHALTPKMVENIVDEEIKKAVKEKISEVGDVKKLENDPPTMKSGLPIRRVRVRTRETVTALADGPRKKFVKLGNNHHVEILETTDKKGRLKWVGEVVTRYEAMKRKKAGEPIIKRNHGPNKKFLFSLGHGESVLMKDENNDVGIYVVSKFTHAASGQVTIYFTRHNDARPKGKGVYVQKDPEPLRKAECKKITVTPIGDARWAND